MESTRATTPPVIRLAYTKKGNPVNEHPIFPPPGGRPFPIAFAAVPGFAAGGRRLRRGGYGYPGTDRRAGTDGYGRSHAHAAKHSGHRGYHHGGRGRGSGRHGSGRRANGNSGINRRAGAYCYGHADPDPCAAAHAGTYQYASAAAHRCAAAYAAAIH